MAAGAISAMYMGETTGSQADRNSRHDAESVELRHVPRQGSANCRNSKQ